MQKLQCTCTVAKPPYSCRATCQDGENNLFFVACPQAQHKIQMRKKGKLTWYFLMLSNCSNVGSTICAICCCCTAAALPLPATRQRRSGSCGAGAQLMRRPSFSMRRWSRGGGTGFELPLSCTRYSIRRNRERERWREGEMERWREREREEYVCD